MSSQLITLLDQYITKFDSNQLDEQFKALVLAASEDETSPTVFKEISEKVYDKYYCVDVILMISILRRWLAIAPNSVEAKHSLGQYLLIHGPDWDDEANILLK